MSFEGIHNVHFLGIGGIGMSALARWFTHEGYVVSGFDRSPSSLTDALSAEGMKVVFEDRVDTIPEVIKANAATSLIIWTPAMPEDSPQLNFFKEQNYSLKKRSEVLGMVTKEFYTIAVAGTHGKTTTSSMIAHVLKCAGKSVIGFLGGITQNYQSNLILGKKKSKEQTIVVVEADEFDRSFLALHPNEAVVTSADSDHLDIYGDELTILNGYREFVRLINKKGKLYIQHTAADRLGEEKLPKVIQREYGLRSSGITAENIKARQSSFVFDYRDSSYTIKGLELFIPGFHNVENALVAIAIALDHQVSEEQIRESIKSFKGVKRRFEIHANDGTHVYIDDYAHHPEEIRACLSSVRAMFPAKKLTVVFQPHLYSRTRDFAAGFSESLSLADSVILLDIYPAREEPIAGVSSEMLLKDIQTSHKELVSKVDLIAHLDQSSTEILVTLGAGDIDRLVPEIASWMKEKHKILAT